MALRVIDDRDPAIEYIGAWGLGGNPQEEYNGTTTLSEIPGSTARVSFTGTGISVFGTVEISSRPVSNYTIEGNPSTEMHFVGGGPSTVQYGVKFYEVKDLDPGRHVLIITNEQLNARLYLDYFTVIGENTQSIAPTSSSRLTGRLPIPSATSSSLANPAAGSSSPPIGAIIGGVLGGLALIGLLVIWMVLRSKRRHREFHLEHGVDSSQVSGLPPIIPFVLKESQHVSTSSQSLAYTSRPGPRSIASSSQAVSHYHNEKQTSTPTSPSSNPPSLPPGPRKDLDPPPRYER